MKNIKGFVLLLLLGLAISDTARIPRIRMTKNAYIQVKVGESELTMALDPSSNINVIFNSRHFPYKHYTTNKSSTLKVSNAQIIASTSYGTFKGNLANEAFSVPLEIDYIKSDIQFRLNFVLAKEAKGNLLPDEVDGILSLATTKKTTEFYSQMSLIEQMIKIRILKTKKVIFNKDSETLSFGEFDFKVNNKTTIQLNNNEEEADRYPLKFTSSAELAFTKQNSDKFDVDKEIDISVSFVQLPQPIVLFAPTDDVAGNVRQYMGHVSKTVQTLGEDSGVGVMASLKEEDMIKDVKSSVVVGGSNFEYTWLSMDEERGKRFVNLKVGNIASPKLWTINMREVFNSERVCFNYEDSVVEVINCKACGKVSPISLGPILNVVVFLLIAGIVGILLCAAFTKFVHFRREASRKKFKSYELIKK